jgi:hypothetical protein
VQHQDDFLPIQPSRPLRMISGADIRSSDKNAPQSASLERVRTDRLPNEIRQIILRSWNETQGRDVRGSPFAASRIFASGPRPMR